jgi:hypothetical protein
MFNILCCSRKYPPPPHTPKETDWTFQRIGGEVHFVKISSGEGVPKPRYFQRVNTKLACDSMLLILLLHIRYIWSNASSTTKTYTMYCANIKRHIYRYLIDMFTHRPRISYRTWFSLSRCA